MEIKPIVLESRCVDCDVPVVFVGQMMLRCDDCLFQFIVKAGEND